MTVVFAEENFYTVKDDILPLIEDHWEEIAVNKDKIKLNPDWEAYEALYQSGSLGVYTAREDGALVGYLVVTAARNPHYKDHVFASNDILFLTPSHRKGFTGYKLIKFVEKDLKGKGISVFIVNTKVHQPFDVLMKRLGFSLIERTYSKYLGE